MSADIECGVRRQHLGQFDQPLVVPLHEVAGGVEARERARQWLHFAGRMAVDNVINSQPESEDVSAYPTLMDAIHCAANNDPVARQVVFRNTMSDLMERSIKSGIVMRIPMSINTEGKILQHGQLMEDVFKNAWRFVANGWQMQERTKAEIYNGAQLENPDVQKMLRDYYTVTFSCAPDNMTEQEAEKIGFFPDTMTCAIQVIGRDGDSLTQESALVAGKSHQSAERHDLKTVPAVAARLGIDFTGKTVAQMLSQPLLVHKSLMPGGVIDIVKLYDEQAGGTFFGQAKPRKSYEEYVRFCHRREAGFQSAAQTIVDQLIANSASIHEPIDATKLLHQFSQSYLVDKAFKDTAIDPRVFGVESARHIMAAREFIAQGNMNEFLKVRNLAQNTARSSSCPAAFGLEGKFSGSEKADPNDPDSSDLDREGVGNVHYAVCIIAGCPSRPSRTLVGGCDVCLHRCQRLYDKGIDPTTVYQVRQPNHVPLLSFEAYEETRRTKETRSDKSRGRLGSFITASAVAA